MTLPLKIMNQRYTFAEYMTWDDGERWEIIEGTPYLMSPVPTWVHQGISGEIFLQLAVFLKGKQCKVFHAPFDVRLFPEDDNSDDTVVQPDLVVICDRSKYMRTGCAGPPDMVVEILSPGTARHDRFVKLHLYKKAGVREYWIVDPETKVLSTFILKDGEYVAGVYGADDAAPVHILEGLSIDLAEVFAEAYDTDSK